MVRVGRRVAWKGARLAIIDMAADVGGEDAAVVVAVVVVQRERRKPK